jgi:hypothetical protein|tara:strand:- start:4298 stop:4522 length:225 start_codon:yes stop_codon:yes gene_type:complete
MGLIDKVDPKRKKTTGSKPKTAMNTPNSVLDLEKKHIEWLLRTIGDSVSLRGSDLQVAIDSVQWLQNEYKRLTG